MKLSTSCTESFVVVDVKPNGVRKMEKIECGMNIELVPVEKDWGRDYEIVNKEIR